MAAASSPAVEITQQGETLSIKTSTSVRTTHVSFTVGQSFNEATVDGRPCTVHVFLLLIKRSSVMSIHAYQNLLKYRATGGSSPKKEHMEIILAQLENQSEGSYRDLFLIFLC